MNSGGSDGHGLKNKTKLASAGIVKVSLLAAAILATGLVTGATLTSAFAQQVGSVTGLPLPRYVSLKSDRVNLREGWSGHLWQERFHSFVMDESHLVACARYVELNPVRARLVARPEDWPWSSARAHLAGEDDRLVSVAPLLDLIGNWRDFLAGEVDEPTLAALRRHSRTGRPLGGKSFLDKLEARVGRSLRRGRPGPKPKRAATASGKG